MTRNRRWTAKVVTGGETVTLGTRGSRSAAWNLADDSGQARAWVEREDGTHDPRPQDFGSMADICGDHRDWK